MAKSKKKKDDEDDFDYKPDAISEYSNQSEKIEKESNNLEARKTRIGNDIIKMLGKPQNFDKVFVHHLWGNRFRVNVFISNRHTKIVSDSFFVTEKLDGLIIDPPIKESKYGRVLPSER